MGPGMAAKFYIRRRGRDVEGPVNAAQLRALASTGRLNRWDEVTRDMRQWIAAGKVTGLRFADAPPAPPADTTRDPHRPTPPPRRAPPQRRAPAAGPPAAHDPSGETRLAATRVLGRIDRDPMGPVTGRGCAMAWCVTGAALAGLAVSVLGRVA